MVGAVSMETFTTLMGVIGAVFVAVDLILSVGYHYALDGCSLLR
jgi:hypothetical protein